MASKPDLRCIHCASPVKALYREYSKGNIRLEQCKHCKQFADHYIENDAIVVFIDMLLLKKNVFTHLVHNRLTYNELGMN
ncbi:sterol homeostasis protein, partial [Podochytrium sp. JEL0797]